MKLQLQRWVDGANVWVDASIVEIDKEFTMSRLIGKISKKVIWRDKFRFVKVD